MPVWLSLCNRVAVVSARVAIARVCAADIFALEAVPYALKAV